MRTADLFNFIKERHSIYLKRQAGVPKPWTSDSILQTYKFCNMYRELDTGTKWFADGWRKDNADDPDLWFNSLVYRFINWPETMEEIGYGGWRESWFIDAIECREARGQKIYSSAYMISTHGVAEKKSTYLAKSLTKIWAVRDELRYAPWEGLHSFHNRLMGQFDVGSFIAAQVVADCKYVGTMTMASDWWTFAASGPGSRRGLNRVCQASPSNPPINEPWKEESWRKQLMELKAEIDPLLKAAQMPKMHAQDLQNCLCEFDKYERVRLGEGRPKSKYPGV